MRAILFDLDNTLIDRESALRAYAAGLMARFPHALPADPAARAVALEETLAADRWGYRNRIDYCGWVVERFPALNMTAEELWDDFRQGVPAAVEPEPAVRELVRALGERYRLGIVSNGSGELQRRKMASAQLTELITGPIAISGEVGADKPDPRPFRYALDRLGVPVEETIYVGDHPEHDVVGGHGVGLRVCWISMGRSFPSDATDRPDWTIERVTDLPTVLSEALP